MGSMVSVHLQTPVKPERQRHDVNGSVPGKRSARAAGNSKTSAMTSHEAGEEWTDEEFEGEEEISDESMKPSG